MSRVFVFVLMAACGAEEREAVERPPALENVEPAQTQTPPTPAPAQPPAARTCDDVQADFRRTLEAGTNTCNADDECACYNPVAEGLGCGGVIDRATADRLTIVQREFHSLDCDWPIQCAPWACSVQCVEGRCVEGPPRRR